jgi:sugar phosphate isomerase/epimerase
VELKFKKIKAALNRNSSLKDIIELLEVYDLEASSIFSLKDFSLCSEREYKVRILPTFKQMIEYCNKLECDLLIVSPSNLDESSTGNEIPQWRILNRTTKRLEELSKKAQKSDVKIGFEYSPSDDCSIATLNDAKEVLNPLESRENVGYVIDTFSLIKNDNNINILSDIKELIWLIQLSDVKYETKDDLQNIVSSDRIFPGDGSFNWKEFVYLLQKLRYRGNYSLELSRSKCPKKMYEKIYSLVDGIIRDYWRTSY